MLHQSVLYSMKHVHRYDLCQLECSLLWGLNSAMCDVVNALCASGTSLAYDKWLALLADHLHTHQIHQHGPDQAQDLQENAVHAVHAIILDTGTERPQHCRFRLRGGVPKFQLGQCRSTGTS